jgi:D-beta-D-heptose 7-phosphate kinase/D-beta-D-heptose 1-phosphate adenosyltransferase
MPHERDEAIALLDRMDGLPIVVIGDIMLDLYLWGDTARISPEAPVPIIEARNETVRLGGAANVARNIRELGGRPWLIGVVGDDHSGRDLRREIGSSGIAADRIFTDPTRRTTTKTRVVARHQQVVRVDREDVREIDGATLDRVREAAMTAVRGAAGIVISDYGKGVLVPSLLPGLLGEAIQRRIPICVDPKESHFQLYRGVTVLTPNLHEAGIAFGRRITDPETLHEAGHLLRSRLEAKSLLITQGEGGMTLYEEDDTETHYPALATEVFDVTGAGDTVVSCFAMAAAAGGSLRSAALLANHAAGLVVREVGTAAASPEAIRASISRHAKG